EGEAGIGYRVGGVWMDLVGGGTSAAQSMGSATKDAIAALPLVHDPRPPDALNFVKSICLISALCAATLEDSDPKARIRQLARNRSTSRSRTNNTYVASKRVW